MKMSECRIGGLPANIVLPVLFTVPAILISSHASAGRNPDASTGISLPSLPMDQALSQLAQETGTNILFTPNAVQSLRSHSVTAARTAREAVTQAIQGTPLAVRRDVTDAILVTVVPQPAADPPVVAKPASPPVEEVVVVSRKRAEKLQDVPLPVTAIDGRELRRGGHVRIEDLNQLVPSMNVTTTNGHQASYTIRGLGANVANDGLEGSTGVFVDGVYLGRPGMAVADLIDIKQIETLRGPQNTLFGKNTTAGVINITTDAPSFKPAALFQGTYGNYNYTQFQGTATGPIIGNVLAGRLTAYKTDRDGTIDDVYLHDHVATLGREGVRAQLLYEPTDDFNLRVIGEYAREQQSTGATTVLSSLGATPALLERKAAATGGLLVVDPTGATTAAYGPLQTGTRQYAFSGEANWQIGEFKLTSISAYRNWTYLSNSDSVGAGVNVLSGGYRIRDNQESEELRLTAPQRHSIDSTLGLYYFRQKVVSDAQTYYGRDAAAWLTGVPLSRLERTPSLASYAAYNNSHWDTWATPLTNSYSGFAQGTWHITRRWNLTAGFRETYETKDESVWRPNPTSTLTGDPVAAFRSVVYPRSDVGIDTASPSYTINTDYHITPQLMAYGLVSRGEKAGGVNTTVPPSHAPISTLKVLPETATDFETGIKGSLFGQRMRYGIDGYYTYVQNYQANYLALINGASTTLLTNVGKVRTAGAEVEVNARLSRDLTLTASGSYNDAHYAFYPSGPCAAGLAATSCDLTNRPVSFAPKWIANLRADYGHQIGQKLTAYGGVEYSWRSSFYANLDDSPLARTGNFAVVNLRAGVQTKDGRWNVMLWGKNVFDRRYVVNYLNYGSILPGTYVPFFGDFATYGFTVTASF